MSIHRRLIRESLQARQGLIWLAAFTGLLGLINCLLVNQRVVLYLFYVPVVLAAWFLRKRDSVGVAVLAALMVIAYVFFRSSQPLVTTPNKFVAWAELVVWGGILVVTAYVVCTLKGRLQKAMDDLRRAYEGVLAILSRFIQTVDADTEAHGVRVSGWAASIAKEMGLKPNEVEEVRIAGLLHDVGKVDVSVDLLRKASRLSQDEQAEVRRHTDQGARLVKPLGGMLTDIADAIETHHEKYDGSGYKGLKGQEIPPAARIIAVADAFDAMISDRPYRKGVTMTDALQKVIDGASTHFDPEVVDALRRIVSSQDEFSLMMAVGSATRP